MKYRTFHMARQNGSIGKFTPSYGEAEAKNESEALEKARRELEKAGFETAGGTAECLCSCHCGGFDGSAICKQPCDECVCPDE